MAKKNQITVPRRTDKKVQVIVTSGLDTLDGYEAILTVKLVPKSKEIVLECEGIIQDHTITFDITNIMTDIPANTYEYDVVIIKDEVRTPLVKSDFVVELWPSSIPEPV